MHALVTGDNSMISPALRIAFTKSGTSHVVAVSGMHIAVLTGVVLMLLKGRSGIILSTILVLLFTFLTGAPPSVLRAAVMFLIAMAAKFFHTEPDTLSAYGAALLFLVVRDPYVVGDIGFVLTFLSTLGILLFCKPMTELVSKHLPQHYILRKALTYFVVLPFCCTISAQLFTMPVVALAFGNISLVAPLANLVVPLMVTLLLPIGLVTAVLSFLFPVGALLAAAVARPILALMVWSVKGFAALPYACVPADEHVVLCMLAALYLLWGVYHVFRRLDMPLIWPAMLSLLLVISGVALSAAARRDVLQVYLPDITGGSAAAVICNGEAVVVDCGAPNPERAAREMADFLALRGIEAVDSLVLLSQEPDEQNGMEALQEMLPIREGLAVQIKDGYSVRKLEEFGIKYNGFTGIEKRDYNGMEITCFAQPGGSMLMRLATKDFAMLFACAGKAGIQQETICDEGLKCDIMLIDDTFAVQNDALESAVIAADPSYVIVRDNSYGREVPTRGINGGQAVSFAQSGDILITVR